VPDPADQASLRDPLTPSVANPQVTTDGQAPAASTAPPPAAGQRYELLGEIARGGMGVIYRATDTALGREVAVKVLHERFAPDSGTARRFADEARIAAQLQHPAIPPVHELGTLADGRPFLAMKLIKGQTLEDLLRGRPEVSAERGRFLAVFEQVCQAIAYAHVHHVIHRDLKPANVMVGAFGEVQVMDWGLAKVLTERPAAADTQETTAGTQVVSLRDSDGSFTQAGSVLGTPAFMPPEQAAGLVGKIDARSDVFGLGGILAVILTGQAPFAAASAETTRLKAVQGDVADCFARLDACGAEPELLALCKRCLRPKPADRPAGAEEVAQAVANLRSAAERRAREAEVDHAKAEVQAAEKARRRRALAVAGGILVVVLVAGVVASSLLAWRSHQDKTKAEEAEKAAVAEKVKAEQAEAVALAQSNIAIDALGNMVSDVQNELQDVPGSYEVRRGILNEALKLLTKLNDTTATSDRVIRRHILAHMQVGDIAWALADRERARKEYVVALELAQRAFEMNPQSDKAKGNLMAMHVKVGEAEQFHALNFDVAMEHYQVGMKGWSELVQKARAMPNGDPNLGEQERMGLQDCERALADAYNHIAQVYMASPDASKRDHENAEKCLKDAFEILNALCTRNPSRDNRNRLAFSYLFQSELAMKRNDVAGMISNYEQELKLRQSILKDFPNSLKAKRDVAEANLRLGDAACYAHKNEKAYEHYREGLRLYEQALWSEPNSRHYRGRVSQAHYCVGCGASREGDKKTAQHHFQESLKIREEIYREGKEKGLLDRIAQTTLMLSLARCGEHERAVAMAEEMRPNVDIRVLAEEISCTYGLCMAVIERDRKLDELTPDERKLRDHYHDMAIAAIREGVSKGYDTVIYLEADPDMDPLLALPEFRAWLSEFKDQLNRKASSGKE
jgi:serine/threonine protein kinase